MSSTSLRDMLVKQEPRPMITCFVCSGSRAEYTIFSKPNGNRPFFPFLEHHQPPEDAQSIGPDGSVQVCLVCYSFLTQQWDSYERSKTPQSKRIYWLKRLDNGPFAGMEQNLQQDYESLFENSHVGEHEQHERTKRVRNVPSVSAELTKSNVRFYDQTESRDSSSCSFQSRSENVEAEPDNPANNVLDLSMPSRTPSQSSAIMPSAINEVCFVCGQESKNTFNIFAKAIANCPYFPSLLYHQKPPNAKPMDSSGKVLACEHCHRSLLQQWDYYQRHHVPHHDRAYQLKPPPATTLPTKKEPSVHENTFVCFTCGMVTSSTAQRMVYSQPQKEGEPYFSFLQHINPHPGASVPVNGKTCVCSVCYKSLFRQLRVFELSGIPEERRKYKILSETVPEEFSVLRQHLKTGDAHPKYLPPSECYTCGKQMDASYSLDTVPQSGMYFPFIRSLVKPPHARPIDHLGQVKVCGQCHTSLGYQWEAFELNHIPVAQRQYRVQNHNIESNSTQHSANSNRISPAMHVPAHRDETISKKNVRSDICIICERLLTADNVHVLDTLPQKEGMHFPFIRGLIRPENEKFVDQFGRVLACTQCHVTLKNQWDLFEAARVPHSQRQYKVLTPNNEKEGHLSSNMLVRNASAALHVQVSSPDFRIDLNKFQTNMEPLLTTVTTLPMPNVITSNAQMPSAVLTSHSPHNNEFQLSQVKLPPKTSSEDFGGVLRISGPLDIPYSRPLLAIATTCFVCGEYSPSGHIYAVRSTPLTSANGSDKVPESNRIPYFPFLSKHVPSENAEKLMEDGNALVCTFCYHSLMSQWLAYETSPHPEDNNPWHRRYNTYHYVCYICGITTYRKRVCSISVRDFPFLVEHNRPPGALTLHNGESVVTCLTCFESVTSQWKDFERMKVPLEMRKYNWIVTPPPPDDEQSRSSQSLSGQDSSSVPYVSISSEEHAQFEQRPPSNYEDLGLPHGSKPPPPHLGMQPPYVSSKPVNRSIAAVSPLHQVPSHPNSVFSPFNTGSSAALSATRTSSFAAALRKLAKQAVDPVAEKELSPISPVPSPALSQQSNTPKRHIPPSAFLNNLSQAAVSVGSPPLVTMAPNHSNLSHGSDKRKSLEIARYSSSGSNSSSLSAEPVSLKMDSKSSHPEKRNDHLLGTKPMSSTHQQISTVSGIPTSHPESVASSRGFQPYRSSEDVHHSLPNHAYDPPPSANVGGYPYPSAFMPTSHLTHPAYRLDESLYLERYGLLRPPIMPFPSSAGMLPHPSVPLYPGSRYPPELLTQPVGLVSPRSSAFNQERLKQEDSRLKDNVSSHEREIYQDHERERDVYQDREREQREIEESARNERSRATHSPASFNMSGRGGSPGRQGSITQGTPRELAARKPSSPVSSSPLNLATHSSQMLFKSSRPKESDLWYARQPNISNGQDHEGSPYKGEHDSTTGLRQPPPPLTVSSQVQHQSQMKLSAPPNLEKNSSSIIYSKSAIHPHGRDYQKLSSSDAFHDSSPNVHINGVLPREKHLYNSYPVWDNHQTSTEKQSTNTSSEFPFKNSFDVKNGAIHSQDEWQPEALQSSDRPTRHSQHEVNQEVPKSSASVVNSSVYSPHVTEESRYHQFQSGTKETSLTRALLQNHITPSFVEDLFYANREQTCNAISKLDLKESRIRNIRLNGNFVEGEEDIDSESDPEEDAKLHCFLFIRKGPPVKLDTSQEKLNLLKNCGLTTQNNRRAFELRKFLKRRRMFRERSPSPLVDEVKPEEPSPSLTDTQNLSELSKRLCLDENLEAKAEFLKMLGLLKTTPEEKIEKEKCWRAIEKDRARRNGLLGSGEHCIDLPVRRCRNNVRSILNGLKRHVAKNSQLGKNDSKHPNGMFPSPALLSNADSFHKGNNRDSSVRVLSSFLKPPSKTITTPVPPLIPTPKATRASPSITEQKEARPVVVLSQDPRVRQLKDFAQEFHESVLQTTQMQLEKKTAHSSQIVDSTLQKIPPSATEPCGKDEKEALSPRKIFRWPGIEAIMESYESHVTDQNAEKEFLTERCQKLRITIQEHNKQIECLGQRKTELLQAKEQLEAERQNLQSTIDSLKSFFQHFSHNKEN